MNKDRPQGGFNGYQQPSLADRERQQQIEFARRQTAKAEPAKSPQAPTPATPKPSQKNGKKPGGSGKGDRRHESKQVAKPRVEKDRNGFEHVFPYSWARQAFEGREVHTNGHGIRGTFVARTNEFLPLPKGAATTPSALSHKTQRILH